MLITIDGFSSSGKSSIGNIIEKSGVRVLRADDFFYPRGEAHHKLSGNFNSPFFVKEVISKLDDRDGLYYRAFDCKRQRYYIKYESYNSITVLDGSYSSTSLLDKYRNLSIFIDTSLNTRLKRLKRRGVNVEEFTSRWMKDEMDFMLKFKTYKNAVVIDGNRPINEIAKEIMDLIAKENSK